MMWFAAALITVGIYLLIFVALYAALKGPDHDN